MKTISLLFAILWSFGIVVHGSNIVDEQSEVTASDTQVDENEEVVDLDTDETSTVDDALNEATSEATEASGEESEPTNAATEQASQVPAQSGPLVDLFGPSLLSLEMTGPSTAQLQEHLTMDALRGKKVIGVYFSVSSN